IPPAAATAAITNRSCQCLSIAIPPIFRYLIQRTTADGGQCMRSRSCWLALVLGLVLCAPARAELVALDIRSRAPFAGGQSFGNVGPYDQITALARFAIDSK